MNKRGFSLIEVVIALGIYVLISMVFFSFLKAGIDSNKVATRLSRGAKTAQAQMEEIRSASFEGLSLYNGTSFAEGKGQIAVTTVFADLKGVRLELEWSKEKAPIRLHTLRSKYE